MKIFYFVQVTGTDSGVSGIARVVRNLARELAGLDAIEFVPVFWNDALPAIAHAEQKLLDNLSRSSGPELVASADAGLPVKPSPGDWLLVPEVPHLRSHYVEYPSVHLDEVVGYAVGAGLRVAIVFHDILPLIFGVGGKLGRSFLELTPRELRQREDDLERLAFARYAHAVALVDLVLPVSRTAAASLRDWLLRHGRRADRLPPIAPTLLPEEIFGERPTKPLDALSSGSDPVEFVALGLVNGQKNQLAVMTAFLDLVERRPDLNLRLNVVGIVQPEAAMPASLLAKRSGGRIVLHGRQLSDGQVRAMVKKARATVFLSLAEGFGLPIAESLWRGKPCLCSNIGSMAEIARGGGCLTVDPHNLDAISAGLETLASNPAEYERLLREIAARPLKTWGRYADEIAAALSAVSAGRAPQVEDVSPAPAGRPASEPPASAAVEPPEGDGLLFVAAADWSIPDAFASAERSRSLFHGGAIHYDQERDGAVRQETLFFGPYVSLPPGRYTLKLDGELEGALKLKLTAHEGRTRILETTLDSFAKPIAFVLTVPVANFEISGSRTPQLRRLTLRSAIAERRGSAPPASDPSGDGVAASFRVFDEDGAPLALPTLLPGSKLRTHEAYDATGGGLRDGEAIVFEQSRHGDVDEDTLFYGPYLRLEPGLYALRIVGELTGKVRLRVTADFANTCLYEAIATSFDAPILLELTEPLEKIETIATRTADTQRMRLDYIVLSQAPPAAASERKRTEPPRPEPKRSLAERVFGRSR